MIKYLVVALILTLPSTCHARRWVTVIASHVPIATYESVTVTEGCETGVCRTVTRLRPLQAIKKSVLVTTEKTATVVTEQVSKQRRIFKGRKVLRKLRLFRRRCC